MVVLLQVWVLESAHRIMFINLEKVGDDCPHFVGKKRNESIRLYSSLSVQVKKRFELIDDLDELNSGLASHEHKVADALNGCRSRPDWDDCGFCSGRACSFCNSDQTDLGQKSNVLKELALWSHEYFAQVEYLERAVVTGNRKIQFDFNQSFRSIGDAHLLIAF
jgi:hypothetical protein